MKAWKAKLWLTALALQLPSSTLVAETLVAETPRRNAEMPRRNAPGQPATLLSAAQTPGDDAPPAVGILTVQWTITGRRDPLDCGALGSERFMIVLRSEAGEEEESAEGPCDAFQLSFDVPPGSYAGEALLIDRFDRPVTLSVPVDEVDVVAGRDLEKSVDFPVGAFLSADSAR